MKKNVVSNVIEYKSVHSFNSKVPGFETVRITIKKFSHGVRTQLRIDLAKVLEKVRECADEMDEILESIMPKRVEVTNPDADVIQAIDEPFAGLTNATHRKELLRIQFLKDQIDLISASEVDPVYLNAGFVSVDGIVDDNKNPYTAQSILATGDEFLVKEIIDAIKAEADLSAREKRNLELPITSGGQGDGQASTIDSTAANAS